jgi:hypothetical protein
MIDTGISSAPEAAFAVVVLYFVAALFGSIHAPDAAAPLASASFDCSNCNAPVERQARPDRSPTALFWASPATCVIVFA